MNSNLPKPYIALKVNRDFGEIITTYFDFLKQNIKKFTNLFLSYNGIFLIGLLIVSYLLVTGFIGLISSGGNNGFETLNSGIGSYGEYFFSGGVLFFIIFVAVAILNYSLAACYMITYEEKKGMSFDKQQVWAMVKDKLGVIIGFVLLLILIYLAMLILNFLLLIIPIIGVFAQYIIQFFISAWVGVSFFYLVKENKNVTEAYVEGWNLVTKDFWKSIGVNFILGLLNGVLLLVVLIIPGILVGFYSFHVIHNNVDVSASIAPTIIYTLAMCVFLIVVVFTQCLTQFVNGILFYALHEKTYNLNTRSKIDEIGGLEQ